MHDPLVKIRRSSPQTLKLNFLPSETVTQAFRYVTRFLDLSVKFSTRQCSGGESSNWQGEATNRVSCRGARRPFQELPIFATQHAGRPNVIAHLLATPLSLFGTLDHWFATNSPVKCVFTWILKVLGIVQEMAAEIFSQSVWQNSVSDVSVSCHRVSHPTALLPLKLKVDKLKWNQSSNLSHPASAGAWWTLNKHVRAG